jgi:regulation of enolase protein 1 (concanavalin A-like superfamily)
MNASMNRPWKKAIVGGAWAGALFFVCAGTAGGEEKAAGQLTFEYDFNGRLGDGWVFEREERANWRVGPAGLEVRVQPGNMWGGANNAKNVLVHPIPAPKDALVEICVTISNQPTAQWEQANLVWFYDDSNMVKLGQELVTGRYSIVMGREEGDRARTVAIIPLDANTVELRLQAVGNQVRGQFRTAPWRDWRDVGECDLPVKGAPKVSLHFYNGPPNEAHWVRVNNLTVRQLPPGSVVWPRVRTAEKSCRSTDSPRTEVGEISLPGNFTLLNLVKGMAAEAKPDYEQSVYLHRDGSYGWRWDRRASVSKEPTVAGVGLGATALWSGAPKDGFQPIRLETLKSLELELDAVTRLENDHGDHNLVVLLALSPATRLAIWFDWYGKTSDAQSLNDGYREYGYVQTPAASGEIQYRIRGFRGGPPRVNLKAFLDDATKRGLAPQSELRGVWFGNEVWNGSRGGTLVTHLDLIVDGQHHASVK